MYAARYGWIIDRVNTLELGDESDEQGTMGPSNIPDTLAAALLRGEGHMFRMLDDDGIWYYRGRIVFTSDDGPPRLSSRGYVNGGLTDDEGELEFGPLEDFGEPNAGCVHLQYRCTDANGDLVWAAI